MFLKIMNKRINYLKLYLIMFLRILHKNKYKNHFNKLIIDNVIIYKCNCL